MLFIIVAKHFSRKNFATIRGNFSLLDLNYTGFYLCSLTCLYFNAVWKGTWYPNKAGNLILLQGHTV